MSLLGGLRSPLPPLLPLVTPTQTALQTTDPAPMPKDPSPAAEAASPTSAPEPLADQPALFPPAATTAPPPRPDPLVQLQVESAVRASADRPTALPPPASAEVLAEARRLALAAQERFLTERLAERLATPPVPPPGLPAEPERKAEPPRVTASAPTLDLRR